MKRRQFIKQAAMGTVALTVGLKAPFLLRDASAQQTVPIRLGMIPADVEMVDTRVVPHWLFTVNPVNAGNPGQPGLPGPMVFAYEDEEIVFEVHNFINDGRNRRFSVVGNNFQGNPFANLVLSHDDAPGVPEVMDFGTGVSNKVTNPANGIGFGESVTVTIPPFTLLPGSYIYKDPTLGYISRVLGLHGALTILPSRANGVITNPYRQTNRAGETYPANALATPNVTALFNDLGAGTPLYGPDALFPGEKWFATTDDDPSYNPLGTTPGSDMDWHHHQIFKHHPVLEKFYYRTRIWIHSAIDPVQHVAIINRNGPDATLNNRTDQEWIAAFRNEHLPHYFTINGRMGVYSAHSHDIASASTVGQPMLIRMLNCGLVTHSPHFHANHVFVVADNNAVGGFIHFSNQQENGTVFDADNVAFVDTTTLGPESRYDVVFPFTRPPDIPKILDGNGMLLPIAEVARDELNMILGGVKQDPMTFPMHCHTEMAQTAAGGNYPQGQVIHTEYFGEFGTFFKPRNRPSIVPLIQPLLLDS